MAVEREPAPHDFAAEEAVLGSLLIEGEAIARVIGTLKPEHFYREKDSWAYEACTRLASRGEPINQVSVAHELGAMGKLEAMGGPAFLSYLQANTPTSVHIEHYAALVQQCAERRGMLAMSTRIRDIALDLGEKLNVCKDRVLAEVEAVRTPAARTITLNHIKKVQTSPPHYEVGVNGRVLKVPLGTLLDWRAMRKRIVAELDFIPRRPQDWDQMVDSLLRVAEREEAPFDASEEEQARLAVVRFLELKGEGKEWSDLQGGCYILRKVAGVHCYCFQPSRLLDWLKRERTPMKSDQLWMLARAWGASKVKQRVKRGEGSIPLDLWAIPTEAMQRQREEEMPEWF